MMPLTFAAPGEENTVKKITGKDETRRFLANLGFVEGGKVTVISEVEIGDVPAAERHGDVVLVAPDRSLSLEVVTHGLLEGLGDRLVQ